jgi:hypothetical protein
MPNQNFATEDDPCGATASGGIEKHAFIISTLPAGLF